MRIAAVSLLLAALAHSADFPKALLKDPCATAHPCDAQIWLQLDANHPPFQATHDAHGAEHAAPVISPDGKTIVYGVMEPVTPEHLSPLHIVFLDWSGRELRRIDKVPTGELGGACGYGQIEWVDPTRLGITCEENPSLESYVVLDATSGKVLQRYMGLYFSWSPDRRVLAHVGPIMHFAPPPAQNYCLLFNNEPVYARNCRSVVDVVRKPGTARNSPARFPNIHTIEYPLVWSPDGKKIAFLVSVYDFVSNTKDNDQESGDIVNSRGFLAIVSADGRPAGYPVEKFPGDPRLVWLTGSRIELRSATRGDVIRRTFDLAADPPKPIP
jgi:hypothetical protein